MQGALIKPGVGYGYKWSYQTEKLMPFNNMLSPPLLTDLVSVGSYRTNISMSEFENAKEHGANDNRFMKDTQETQIGGTDGKLLIKTVTRDVSRN